MKTAGYDIALLINERFLNELSGAFYYGGFMTINGTADFYNGTISLEHQIQSLHEDLVIVDKTQIAPALKPYLLMDYRFKLTREPLINFIKGAGGKSLIQVSAGCRIYFFLWQGLEVKFDAELTLTVPIEIVPGTMKLKVDFKNAIVDEFAINYGKNMQMQENLSLILDKALEMYFTNTSISQRIELPCMSAVIKDIKNYIEPDKDSEGNDLGIIPISVDAISVVTDTVMAVGINLMNYHGGNPNELHDFAGNCSLGIAISETCMQKVYKFVWDHSHGAFAKDLNDNCQLVLLKDFNSATIIVSGEVDTKPIMDFWDDINDVLVAIQEVVTKVLTLGFVEASTSVEDLRIGYTVGVTINKMPLFDLQSGNVVRIYDLDMTVGLRLKITALLYNEVAIDTSGWWPDSWTPWEDDVVISRDYNNITIFDGGISIPHIEVLNCKGQINWNEPNQSLELQLTALDLNWRLNDSDSPVRSFPEKLLNWLSDKLEKKALESIKPIAISPKLSFAVPYLPWPLKITGKKLEITDSEAIVAADFGFGVFSKDYYPVPKYIVNENNGEIHKIGCDSVNDTYEVHQRSYHLLSDALNDGYDGCQKCLPAFHKR
jgi:hypothetical protein